ncbi:alpha/beta hydrolase [Streptomyces sioyaensis]|uniref:alpha/beta hydrolase n=1 Tax=Streptomyces sioyaensis TaxID=67364 RepID=UPI003D72796A
MSTTHRRGRPHKRWYAWAAAACATAVALPLYAAQGQEETRGREGSRTLTWQPCKGHSDAQCTTLNLPIDWSSRGKTFGLKVVRRKATNPSKRIGVLLINPGGPGGSGVDMALKSSFPAELRERFDIVGFDPRGIGRSHPITCSKELINKVPQELPRNQAEFAHLASYNRKLREDCRKHSGPLFDHADTLNVVRDMDALRAALGEQKINYYGHSYGTLIGQQYAQRYGRHVRSMVLDSNMDHSLGTTKLATTAAAAVEDSLTAFAQWCKTTSTCSLHGQDVLGRWNRLLSSADRSQLSDADTPVSVDDLISRAYDAFAAPEWPAFAKWLNSLHTGTPHRQAHPSHTGPATGTEAHVRPAVFCQDWQTRIRDYQDLRALVQAEQAAAPHARTSPEMREAILGCVGWPKRTNNPQRPLHIGPDAPTILLVNARHDPTTGYAWARNVHRQAPHKTRLLTYEGSGHGALVTPCTTHAMTQYLLHLTLPPQRSCPAPQVSGNDNGPPPSTRQQPGQSGRPSSATTAGHPA